MPKETVVVRSHWAQPVALFVALLVLVGTLILPIPASWQGTPEAFHVPLAISAVMACTYIGAAGLFLRALSAYKAKLRHAYIVLSVGIVMNAAGTVQLAILNAFDLLQTPWVQTGGVVLPFLLGGLALYIGARRFALLVGARSLFTHMGLMLLAAFALGVVSSLLPHVPSAQSEVVNDISNGVLVWTGALNFAAAGVIYRVRQHVGEHYVNAVAWLFTALAAGVAVIAVVLLVNLLFPETSLAVTTITNLLTVIVGIVYIQAGYAFRRTEEY